MHGDFRNLATQFTSTSTASSVSPQKCTVGSSGGLDISSGKGAERRSGSSA